MKKIVTATLVVMLLLAVPAKQAQAQGGWQQTPITGGCTVGIPAGGAFPPNVTVTWDQACSSGQPVNGQGTLRMSTSDGRTVTMVGTFVAGVPNGQVVMTGFDASGAQRAQRTDEYNMGCQVDQPGGCTPYQPG